MSDCKNPHTNPSVKLNHINFAIRLVSCLLDSSCVGGLLNKSIVIFIDSGVRIQVAQRIYDSVETLNG